MTSVPIISSGTATPYPFTSFDTSAATSALQSAGQSSTTQGASGSSNIDSVSQDFEAVFLSQMLGSMFDGDDITEYFGGGTAGEIYKSFLMNEYGKSLAKAGGVGIAAQVKKELLKLQEVAA